MKLIPFSKATITQEINARVAAEQQAGFSIVELIIAGVLMTGMLLAAGVFNFSGDESKATNIFTVAKELGSAATRYNANTSVNPKTPESLFNKNKNLAADTWEGIPATSTWKGPYVNGFPIGANGEYKIDSFIEGGLATFNRETTAANLPSGATTGFQVVISGLTADIGKRIVANCNGTSVDTAMPSSHSGGERCIGSSDATTGETTVSYLYSSK